MVMKAIAEDGGDVSDDDTEIDQDELMGFAEHLGLVLPDEQDLMWICKMALNAPVPAGWTAHNDGEGNTYYYNAETGASSWDHPSDPYFRGLLRRCRHLKVSASKGLQGSQAALKANEDLNSQLDKLKDKYNQLKEAAAKVSEENDVTTQRAAALEVELADVHLRHKAEIQALTKVHADLRGQTTSLDALASENAQLKAAAAAASEDLKRYRSGEAIDLRARVTDLETSLRAARADAKSAQLAGEQASAREAELQAQLVTAQSSSIRDKSHINALVLAAEEAHRAAAETARRHQEEVSRMEAEMRRSSAAETNAAREREEEKRRGEAAAAEVTRRLDEATRALELLRAQASQAQEALQEASESAVLKVALEEAQARAASLAEQTRQAEADANDAKQQLGEAANRAAAAAERAGELGEEVKRQRMRAEEAETQVLAVSVERDRALSKAKQLEAEVQAKGVALMMREGASSAKVAELSEREVRLSGALEEERARAGALARQLASSKEREENARIEGARLGARMAEVEARGKAVEVELEETKAAVVRAELALHGAGGAGQGDVVDKITAMQTQLMDALAALRAERDKGAALEMARVQAVKDRNESGDELILCRDQCERLEGDVALQAAALASERAAAQRARAQAESELLKERQMVAQLERQCSDIKVWAEQAEDKVLALTGKLEHAQQQARVLGAEVEALRGRGELLRRTLDSVRVEKTKALGEQRGIVAAFRHEVRSLERQLAQEQHQVRQLRRAAREAAGEAAAAGSAQEESLRRERGELLLRVGELQAALDAAGGKAAHLEEACAAAHEECSILRVRQRELEEGVAAAYANFHSAEQAKQAAVSAANAQAARNSQLTQELGHDWRGLQEQLKASDDELARLRRERLTMARQLAGTSEKLEVLQMEADALGHDKKRLQQLVDQLRAGAGGAEQEDIGAAEPQAIIRELRAALRMVQPQIKELQVEVNQLRAEREVVESQANSAKVYFQGQLRVRLTELQAAEAETGRLQEALDAHLAAAHRLEAANAALSQRVRELEEAWQQEQLRSSTRAQAGAPSDRGRAGSEVGNKVGGSIQVWKEAMGMSVAAGGRVVGGPPLPTHGAPKRPRTKMGVAAANTQVAAMPAWGSGTRWMSGTNAGLPGGVAGRTTPVGTLYQRPRSQARGGAGGGGYVATSFSALNAPVQLLPPDVMNQLLGLGTGGGDGGRAGSEGGDRKAMVGKGSQDAAALNSTAGSLVEGVRAEQIGGQGVGLQGLGWGRGIGSGESSSLRSSAGGVRGEATYAAAGLNEALGATATLGATGLGLVAAYDRRKSVAPSGSEGALAGFGRVMEPAEQREPGDGTYRGSGLASIANMGNGGDRGVREVMAAPIVSPSAGSGSSAVGSLLPAPGSDGKSGEVVELINTGCGRGGRGAGGVRMGDPRAPSPSNPAPPHSRPPSVPLRAARDPTPLLPGTSEDKGDGFGGGMFGQMPSSGRGTTVSGRGSRLLNAPPLPKGPPPAPLGVGGAGVSWTKAANERGDGVDDDSVGSGFGGVWRPLGETERKSLSGSDTDSGTKSLTSSSSMSLQFRAGTAAGVTAPVLSAESFSPPTITSADVMEAMKAARGDTGNGMGGSSSPDVVRDSNDRAGASGGGGDGKQGLTAVMPASTPRRGTDRSSKTCTVS